MSTILSSPSITDSSGRTTNAGLSQAPAHTYKGNNTGSTANVADLTQAQLTAELNAFTTTLQGLVPAPVTTSGRFLRDDGTWAAAAGSSYTAGTGLTLTGTVFSLTTPVAATNGGTGVTSLAALTAALSLFGTSTQGLVNGSGTPSGKFLRDDNTWQAVSGGSGITALTGDGTATGPGSAALIVTKTNGVAFAPSATTDTTSASNVTTGTLTLANALAGNGKQLNNIGAPTAQNDAATKDYVDRIMHVVNAATTANLTSTYANGTLGVGATLTSTTNVAFPAQDSFASVVGARYLVKNQTTQLQNGIYSLTTLGSGTVPWVLTRVTDYDEAYEMGNGESVHVVAGTIARWQIYVQSTLAPIVVGTTAIIFSNLQTIAGPGASVSTSLGSQTVSSLLSAAAFGSVPNNNGLTVTAGAAGAANTVAMQPADATHPGGILGTSAAQTLAPSFTFSQPPVMSGVSIANNTIFTSSLVSAATNATGSSIAVRDGNSNSGFNEALENLTSTVTSGTTLALSIGSSPLQILTGSAAQKVVLPDASTTIPGKKFLIRNSSSGLTSVYLNDATTLLVTVPAGVERWIFIVVNSTANGTWSFTAQIANAAMASMAAHTYKGNNTASASVPLDVTLAALMTDLGLTGTNSGDVTVGAFGSSPNANGLSITSQNLVLQPADGTHPGAIAGSGAQTLGAQLSLTQPLALGTNKITGLADPTNPQEAATKNYVDAAVASDLALRETVTIPLWLFPTGTQTFLASGSGLIICCGGAGALATSTDGITWTPRNSGFNAGLINGVTYNGSNLWVAVGAAGAISTSPDGITWTPRNSNSTANLTTVTFANSLFIVTCGTLTTNLILTSPDGIAWTTVSPNFGTFSLNSIAFGASVFVTVGVGGTAFYSSTGTTVWTQTDLKFGGSNAGHSPTATQGFANSGVIFANSLFIAYGDGGSLSTSTDGITWTPRNSGFDSTVAITSVVFGGTTWLAVAATPGTLNGVIAATSPDGITWTPVAVPLGAINGVRYLNSNFVMVGAATATQLASVAISSNATTWTPGYTATAAALATNTTIQYTDVAFGAGVYVATGYGPSGTTSFIHSTDGITWIEVNAAILGNIGNLLGVTFANSLFVAFGTSTINVYTSTDGINWTTRTANLTVQPRQVIFANSTWVLIGATGHVSTSPDAITWTARSSVLSQTLNAIIFANSLFILVGGDGSTVVAVSTAPDATTTWTSRTALFQATACTGIAYLNSLWLAWSNAGALLSTSTDGLTWTPRTTPMSSGTNAVAFGAGLFVIVGGAGRVSTSPTGVTWTSRTSTTSNSLLSITYAASLFVAAFAQTANTFSMAQTSPDGITWTLTPTGFGTSLLQSATFGAGVYVIAGFGNGFYSSDGVNWTQTDLKIGGSGLNSGNPTTVFFANGVFICAAGNGQVSSSTDGITWTLRLSTGGNSLSTIAYGAGVYVAAGLSGLLYSSPDGVTWTARTSQFTSTTIIKVKFLNSLFVAVGGAAKISTSPDGITWTLRTSNFTSVNINDVAFGAGVFVVVGQVGSTAGQISSSPDGATWTLQTSNYSNVDISGVTFGNSIFVAWGQNSQQIVSSPDGVTWTARYNGFALAAGPVYTTIAAAAFGNGVFVLTGIAGSQRYSVSADGINWFLVLRPSTTFATTNAYYLNSLFIVVGGNGTTGPVLETSTDGLTWTDVSAAVKGYSLTACVFTNSLFVAYGLLGGLSTSTDGLTWLRRNSQTTSNITAVSSIGTSLVLLTTATGTPALVSTDSGATWTGYCSQPGSATFSSIAYGASTWVAVGAGGHIVSSSDTLNWVPRESKGVYVPGTGISTLTAVIFANSLFVAVGANGVITTSPDGITWTARNSGLLSSGNTFIHIDYVNSVFFAYGALGSLSTSTDGITWTPRNAQTTTAINKVAFGNSTYVLVGANGRVSYSSDGFTWTNSVSAQNFFGVNQVVDLAFGAGIFVAVAATRLLASSTDGINWTLRNTVLGTSSSVSWNGVTFGNSVFIAYTASESVRSTNGINWTIVRNPGTSTAPMPFIGGFFIAAGGAASTDGITWIIRTGGVTAVGTPLSAGTAIIFANGKFISVSASLSIRSL